MALNESSALVNLRELMGMEEERQRLEHEKRRELEEWARREAEEARERAEREAKARLEAEQRRRLEERNAREEQRSQDLEAASRINAQLELRKRMERQLHDLPRSERAFRPGLSYAIIGGLLAIACVGGYVFLLKPYLYSLEQQTRAAASLAAQQTSRANTLQTELEALRAQEKSFGTDGAQPVPKPLKMPPLSKNQRPRIGARPAPRPGVGEVTLPEDNDPISGIDLTDHAHSTTNAKRRRR